jgi:non-ribosomal peptide synthetase component F
MDELQDSATLAEVLRHQAARRPDATALIHDDRKTGYAELDRRANRIAYVLADLGIRRQDRIGYLGKNSGLYFELLFGAARLGAVLVPLNWRLAPPEIGAILADAGIATLFVGPGFGAVPAALGLSYGLRCIAIGPNINGRILAPAGDWVRITPSGAFQLDVRFTAQTDDNELIYVRYNGVIQCSKEQLDRIQKGEILKANDCYWATAPVFETKSGKLWMAQ